ncbi:hypothetical protein [Paractinoplanes durhamensis]|uniref:Uncharacterized protein n=1 Tax=Paractinoplanes durhamensis TaxID=113563 RepID=A0ABQ3YQK5_9ACTN|nr:hypothetical protein [Actinoplanes durhamensis]GID99866.1 hypothetical protein Adu01nite_12170 [Actinoplanes durhamensis]
MTEDLRARELQARLRADLQAGLHAECPPPLGDVVGAAIRDGRRLRRKRRIGSAVTVIALLAAGGVIVGDRVRPERVERPAALSPQTVPPGATAPMAAVQARTLTIHSGTVRAEGTRTKATSAAMLHLLTMLLPPGRTSHYGVSADDDLLVQLSLDDGRGPAMVRVAVDKIVPLGDEPPHAGIAQVTISSNPGNCRTTLAVDATWPDGTLVEVEVPTCPATAGGPSRPALTTDEAIRIAADPRWGVAMDPGLVADGAKLFPAVPVLNR